MKKGQLILVVLLVINFLLMEFAQAQNQSIISTSPLAEKNICYRKPIPYSNVREADVMWSKRVWRVIDLKEKINLPLYYP